MSDILLSQNLKHLRKRLKRSQEEVAIAIGIKRTSLSGYEKGTSEPPIKTLMKITDYYKINVDLMINADLTKYKESKLSELERGFGTDISGKSLRILTSTIGLDNEENIELVNEKAKAGYTSGYADPEYIKVLPTFRLPFLSREKKYRTFQISGDSMPPVSEGSYVTGEFVQNWNHIKNGTPYIVVTVNDGVVFKVAFNKIQEKQSLLLCSTNALYEPFEVHINDIKEIWKFTNYISNELPSPNTNDTQMNSTLASMQQEIADIKKRMV